MSIKLFDDLRRDRDSLRDRLEGQRARHLELIAGIKALSELLQVRRPSKAQQQVADNLVNRLIIMAKRDYDAFLAEDDALAAERQKGSNDR